MVLIVVTGILIAAVGYIGYVLWTGSQVSRAEAQDSIVGRDVINTLETLNSIQLDSDFLDSLVFSSLVDNNLTITNRPLGRTNPFAAASNVSVSTAPAQQYPENGDLLNTIPVVTEDVVQE